MDMQAIYTQLLSDLTAERDLTPQVARTITDQYGYPEERFAGFFAEKYPALEDYEVDLTFSYLFTPSEGDRERYMALLGAGALSGEAVAALVSQLDSAGLQARFVAPTGETFRVPMNEVSIERYVGLLKLDQPIASALHERIMALFPEQAGLLSLLGRAEGWQAERWSRVFAAFLQSWRDQGDFSAEKARFLSEFVQSHRPAGFTELGPQLENLVESCQSDMERTRGHGFANQQLREAYDESDLKRFADLQVFERYSHMKDLGEALLADLEHIRTHQGDVVESFSQPV